MTERARARGSARHSGRPRRRPARHDRDVLPPGRDLQDGTDQRPGRRRRPPRRGPRRTRTARRRRLRSCRPSPAANQPAHGHDRRPHRGRAGRRHPRSRRRATPHPASPTPEETTHDHHRHEVDSVRARHAGPACRPRAARRARIDAEARALLTRDWERIVLTGMGSSHYVGLPTWRALVGTGRAAWAVDTGDLLENPALLTRDTLLIATSQSGASGEIVELLDRTGAGRASSAGAVVASRPTTTALLPSAPTRSSRCAVGPRPRSAPRATSTAWCATTRSPTCSSARTRPGPRSRLPSTTSRGCWRRTTWPASASRSSRHETARGCRRQR